MKALKPESVISKENLTNLYLVKRIDKESIASSLGICVNALNKIIKYYGLLKENKLKSFEYLLNSVNKKEFINYYKSHNIWDTANHYSTTPNIITQYCKAINYVKGQYLEDKFKAPREDIIQYYVVEDHGYEETAKHFGISTWSFDKLKKEYGIRKDKSIIYSKALNRKWELAGSKEIYYRDVTKKQRQTLKERYGVENAFELATFKKGSSKLNEEFELKLIEANSYESKEFVLKKPEGSYYRYDFKFKNILIELNPSITHNSTFNIFGDSPLDPLYHYNKTKLALENGYKCLCLWDWVDPKDLIALLQSDFGQTQTSPRRHLFNINTKSHIISQDEPFTPGEGWVEIWDDGSEINTNNS